MTSQLHALDQDDRADARLGASHFDALLAELIDAMEGVTLVSQDRCVDGLLDLHNAAPTEVIRLLVVEILDDIRHLSAVRASDLLTDLDELSAATAVESAFFG